MYLELHSKVDSVNFALDIVKCRYNGEKLYKYKFTEYKKCVTLIFDRNFDSVCVNGVVWG